MMISILILIKVMFSEATYESFNSIVLRVIRYDEVEPPKVLYPRPRKFKG